MNLNDITTAMQAYSALRTSNGTAAMKQLFNNLNAFAYQRDTTNPSDGYVHMYPGIYNGTFVFFVISAYKDVSTNTNIENDVETCATTWIDPSNTSGGQLPDGAMPTQEAVGYIDNWINNYDDWITNNNGVGNGVFQAFTIPQVDTSYGNQHNAILGLKQNSGAAGVASDVIVQDVDSSSIVYFDTALPVPPFETGVTAEAAFYLLSLI
jgi:hypothetical protein